LAAGASSEDADAVTVLLAGKQDKDLDATDDNIAVFLNGQTVDSEVSINDIGGGGTAATTTFTPAGNIAATDVQAAIEELDGEKEAAGTAASAVSAHESDTTDVHGISDTSALLDNSDIGASVQGYSAKTAAIAALTWAANNIILLTGTATAAVQALAAHVVTFLGSASAADARAAIGAGTGSGDVTGPGSSVDNAIPRFHETTGKIIQGGSGVTISDASIVTVPTNGRVDLPVQNTPSAPAIQFGSGDGFYSRTATVVNVSLGGAVFFVFHPSFST
jgi:hypothetical protein